MYRNKQANKYRYQNRKCSNERSEFGLFLGFPILSVFDIQNHYDHHFHFWPLYGAKDQKFIDHRSRDSLFSLSIKFQYFMIHLSENKNCQ